VEKSLLFSNEAILKTLKREDNMQITKKALAALLLLSFGFALAGEGKKTLRHVKPVPYVEQINFTPRSADLSGLKKISKSPGVSVVGTSGNSFYDYQTNGGDEKRVRVLPDGTVHVIYMGATDRAAPGGPTRGTYYAYSADNGATFTNLGRVESLRAGFPSLGLTADNRAVIASHAAPGGAALGTYISVDALAGLGIFTAYNAPRAPSECIWPRMVVSTNDRIVFYGSSSTTGGNTWNSVEAASGNFTFPENQRVFPGVEGDIRGAMAGSPGGKVAMILINLFGLPPGRDFGNNNIILRESTDGGVTFGEPLNVTNYSDDTTSVRPAFWLSVSALYVNEELHLVWTEVLDQVPNDGGISYFFTDLRIRHWAPSVNGGVPTTAARFDTVHFNGSLPNGVNHLEMDYGSLGVDADGILSVAFTAFSGDTTQADPITGIGYGDIWAVSSANNGLHWGEPKNLTNSPDMDDRYPYLSPWNEAGKINVFYMSDSVAGNFIGVGADAAPITTPDFLFLKTDHPSTTPYDFYSAVAERGAELPEGFALAQNYPNPFNPSTEINFSLPAAQKVSLRVFNVSGQEVAVLVNGKLKAGEHKVKWNAEGMPSGVYFYRLDAGSFSQVKKMTLLQ
jgi:hypothetical protein